MIAFGTMDEEEAKELEEKIKEVGKWLNSWTPV